MAAETFPPVHSNVQPPRPEIVVGALLHLVTAYRNNRCPGVAACIARHFRFLAAHPDADRIVRDIAAAATAEWEAAARERAAPARKNWFQVH